MEKLLNQITKKIHEFERMGIKRENLVFMVGSRELFTDRMNRYSGTNAKTVDKVLEVEVQENAMIPCDMIYLINRTYLREIERPYFVDDE